MGYLNLQRRHQLSLNGGGIWGSRKLPAGRREQAAHAKSRRWPWRPNPAEAARSFILLCSSCGNSSLIMCVRLFIMQLRHRGGPSPLPRRGGTQRSERLCFTFTNTKECDCRLAQPQDVRGKQKTIINLQLWTPS